MDASGVLTRGKGKERILRAVLSALASQREGTPLTASSEGEVQPVSWAQQQLWMLEQLAPGGCVNNLSVAYRLRGKLSIDRLQRSLVEVIDRHDALRTTFGLRGVQLMQRAQSGGGIQLQVDRLHDGCPGLAPAAGVDLQIEGWIDAVARKPLILGELPLLRASLLQIDACDQLLLLTTHHLAFDGWSFDILMRELCASYAGDALAAPCRLRFGDYAAWQRRRLDGQESNAARTFWSKQLENSPAMTRLTPDRATAPAVVRRSRRYAFRLDTDLVDRVEQLASRNGTTDFVVYLAAYMVLLHRCTATEDVIAGFPVANRSLAETREMIGPFVNMLPVRMVIAAEDTFESVVSRLGDLIPDIYSHQAYPVAALADGVSLGDPDPTQCNFAYQNMPRSDWKLAGLEVEAWDVGSGAIANDMNLFMWRDGTGVGAHVDYDSDRFQATTIAAFCGYLCELLAGAAIGTEEPVSCLPLGHAGTDAINRVQAWGEGQALRAPAMAVHEVFRQQARTTPDAVALWSGDRKLDYATVDRMSDAVCQSLLALLCKEAGNGAGRTIAFCLPPSMERIVLMLAILKAGASYLPLDGALPPAYATALMHEASAGCVVVTDPEPWLGFAWTVRLSELFARSADIEGATPAVSAASAACVMYTSGSSGKAKRIVLPHEGIVGLARSPAYIDPVQGDVFLQLAPLSFDASLFEIWAALLNGGSLVVLPADRPSLGEIAHAIRRYRVGVAWLSSGLFDIMLDAHPEALAALRQLLIGGDVVSAPHVARYLAIPDSGQLFNCYGPTENTTFSSVHRVTRETADSSMPVPIGRPIPGAKVRVLDPAGRPVPAGVVGEACVGGVGLMLAGEGAESRFVWDAQDADKRLYRTGDTVRWRSDGILEFIARHDDQIKLRGFRIEPTQVEAAIRRSDLVSACAVTACRSDEHGLILFAVLVPLDPGMDHAVVVEALQARLRAELPPFMVPQRFAVVDSLPLTANGKADRRTLSRWFSQAVAPSSGSPPRNDEEAFIHAAFVNALGHDRIGIHDDFFMAGGDSLRALQLLAQLECRYGEVLSLVDVFKLRSVASLAARAGEQAGRRGATPLPPGVVHLKRGRATVPLFFVPGGKGSNIEMTLYAELMRHVGGETPVYGFLTKPEREGGVTLHERAALYIGRLRSIRERGPYLLAGECIGGLVALEMARQLQQQGEDMGLMLMDTWCPSMLGMLHYYGKVRPMTEIRGLIGTMRANAAERARGGVSTPPLLKQPSIPLNTKSARLIAAAVRRMVTPDGPRPGFGEDADFDLFREATKHRPAPYPGGAIFITSQHNVEEGIAKPWRRLMEGGLQVITVPGNHETYLREQVATTAEALRWALDAGLRPGATPPASLTMMSNSGE